MIIKRYIALFLGLVIFCFGFTSIPVKKEIKVDFQAGDFDQNAADLFTRPSSSEISSDDGDYFIVRGVTKVFLRRDTRRIAVKFKNNVLNSLQRFSGEKKLQSDWLHQTLNATGLDAELSVEKHYRDKGITIIRSGSPSASSPNLLNSQMREIAAADSVEYATPVFYAKTTMDEMIPTDRILIRFTDSYDRDMIESFCKLHQLTFQRITSSKLNICVLSVDTLSSRSTLSVANALNGQQGVVWAQPNFIHKLKLSSVNDPLFENQWHLSPGPGQEDVDAGVDALEAWTIQPGGSPDITIAIIDDGVDLNHEDLDIWVNPNEIPDNGIDDDENGYRDDVYGWNFYNGNNSPDSDFSNDHGTACAGVAAAKGNNNVGVVGIAYGSKILPIKIVGGSNGEFTDNEVVGEAIMYAADYADVISCSWAGMPDSYIADAIDYAVEHGRNGKGAPVFIAAGNSAARGIEISLEFIGFPAGYRNVAWGFIKDDGGEIENDGAWIDDVDLGFLETFEGVTPPNLPDEDWYTNGAGAENWETVSDPSHAIGNISLKSGNIGNGQETTIGISRYVNTSGGNLSYRVWVDAGPGDGLVALLHNGADWEPYAAFLGEGIEFPANLENSIAVGASNDEGLLSSYSQYGKEIDFVAPSDGGSRGISTTDRTGSAGYSPTNYTDSFGGTSAAAPLAAGIAALLLSKNPELTASEVRTIMSGTCDKIGNEEYDGSGSGWNRFYGYGKLNAYKAIMALESGVPSTGDDGPDSRVRSSGGGSSSGCFVSAVF